MQSQFPGVSDNTLLASPPDNGDGVDIGRCAVCRSSDLRAEEDELTGDHRVACLHCGVSGPWAEDAKYAVDLYHGIFDGLEISRMGQAGKAFCLNPLVRHS